MIHASLSAGGAEGFDERYIMGTRRKKDCRVLCLASFSCSFLYNTVVDGSICVIHNRTLHFFWWCSYMKICLTFRHIASVLFLHYGNATSTELSIFVLSLVRFFVL